MKKSIFSLIFIFSIIASAYSAEVPSYAQIDMKVPPTNPTHVTTKEYVDKGDERMVKYDEDGNLTFPAGMDMNTSIPQPEPNPPIIRTLIDTDSSGNLILGHTDGEVNIQASMRPTVMVNGDPEKTIAFQEDFQGYATEQYVDESVARKADLVDGVVPDSQIPAHVIVRNWGPVPTPSDLVTLTDATVNDRAFVGSADPYDTYYLIAMPPTTQSNWVQSGGGGGGGAGRGGVQSVNNLTGPAVVIDLENLPGVQNALDDKADASDLSGYAPLSGATFTGTTRGITPPTTSNDTTFATTAFVNSIGGKYLPLTGGILSGSLRFNTGTSSAYLYTSGDTPRLIIRNGETVALTKSMATLDNDLISFRLVDTNNVLELRPDRANFSQPVYSVTQPSGTTDTSLATTQFVTRDFLKLSGGSLSGDLSLLASGTGTTTPQLIMRNSSTNLGSIRHSNGYLQSWSDKFQWLTNSSQALFSLDASGAVFAGPVTTVTRPAGTNDTTAATTAFVQNAVSQQGGPFLPLSGGTMAGAINYPDSTEFRYGTDGARTYSYKTENELGVIGPTGGTVAIGISGAGGGPATPIGVFADTGLTVNGTITTPTRPAGTNDTTVATTSFVQNAVSQGGPYLPLSGGILTGNLAINRIDATLSLGNNGGAITSYQPSNNVILRAPNGGAITFDMNDPSVGYKIFAQFDKNGNLELNGSFNKITYGTGALIPGSSPLREGVIYMQYE